MDIEVILHVVLIVLGDRDIVISEDDAEAVDEGRLSHVNNVGAVGAQELRLGQIFIEFLHRHE